MSRTHIHEIDRGGNSHKESPSRHCETFCLATTFQFRGDVPEKEESVWSGGSAILHHRVPPHVSGRMRFLLLGHRFPTPPLSTHSIGTDSSLIICSLLLLRRAIHTRASITGISIKGPTTVETATIGIDAKAVNAIAMASSKFLPVQWNPMVAESS